MITCIDCGKEVERKGYAQKRCLECARSSKREYCAEYDQHYAPGYYDRNRHSRIEGVRRWQRENPSIVRRHMRRSKELDAAISASRNRLAWTPAEDAVVMSWTESLRELGSALGRTVDSIKTRRRDLRRRATSLGVES